MEDVEDTVECAPCERSAYAEKGCRCKALPTPPPALGLKLFMHVISETVRCDASPC